MAAGRRFLSRGPAVGDRSGKPGGDRDGDSGTGPVVGRSRPLLVLTLLAATLVSGCAIPRWPVEGAVSSPYGLRWRGVLPGVHRGVDIRVPLGTPVRAMSPGRVRYAGTMDGFGRVVWIDHGPAVMAVYAHLSEIHVRAGERVEGRAVVGLSGDSGNAEAPLLHFEVWRWGREVDPVPLLGGRPAVPGG